MIYLDNAATSLQKPKEVEEEMIRALHTMGNPGRGAHDATLQGKRKRSLIGKTVRQSKAVMRTELK